jgi:DNA-binding CsgD family transcriptional regulator/tetratricopeptide (TPR) repeat protein
VPSSPSSRPAHADDLAVLYRRTFVGRDTELQQLQSAYDRAAAGTGALIALLGEPGIGKTALCDQLASYVSQMRGRALWGHCYEERSLSLPYLAFVEALGDYVRASNPAQLEEDLGAGAAEVVHILPEVGERLAVQPRSTGDAEDDRWRLLQAVSSFVRNAARRQPILLILEDLHDADRGTLDLLVHLSRQLTDSHVLLVFTYRDVEVDRAHPLSGTLAELRRSAQFGRVRLRGLSVSAVHQMYCQVRGQDVPWNRAEVVHRQTEGNPLFVQEVLRYLVEAGLVVRRGDRYVATDSTALDSEIPEGLRDVVGKRLNRLSQRTNEVLAIAAVIGREFRLDVLQRVSGMSEDDLVEALEEAHERAVIEDYVGLGGSVAFRFTHALFRQTLYEELFAPRRVRWHRQVAAAFEEVYAGRLDDHAGELAEHYAHSSNFADLEKALHYHAMAAQRAMRVYAYGEAARHLERALEVESVLDVRDPVQRCDLLLALGEAMLPMEQPRRIADIVAPEAFAIAESLGDGRRAARVAIQAMDGLSRPWNAAIFPTAADVQVWVERADRYATAGSVERVYAEIWLGIYAVVSGRRADIAVHMRRAVEGARVLGDEIVFGAAAAWALNHLSSVKDMSIVDRLAHEFQALRHDRLRTADVVHALLAVVQSLLRRGERQAAEEAVNELVRRAEESGDATCRLAVISERVRFALLDGRLEDAAAEKAEEEKSARQLGLGHTPLSFSWNVGPRALSYLGRATDELLDDAPESTNRALLAARAFRLAVLGRCDEATLIRRRFSGIESHSDETAAVFLASLFEVAIRCRDTATAATLLGRFAHLADRLESPGMVSYGRLLGEAAVLLGRYDEALAFFEQAVHICEKVRFRPELALTRLDLAELLLTHFESRGAEARVHLDFAIGECESMHMQPSLEKALALRSKVAPSGPREEGGATDLLTPREREVARLLATGRSNREIADTLVISEATVEVHVKHILSKLGFRSRSQVAAWVVETAQ